MKLVSSLLVAAAAAVTGSLLELTVIPGFAASYNQTDHPPVPVSGCNWGPVLKQCDSRWANHPLGTSSNTICRAGCAMSSLAMYLTSRGHSQDPGTLNNWLTSHGGYAQGDLLVWGSVDKTFGVAYQGQEKPSSSVMASGLAQCHGLIANVHNGGHWVLLTGYRGNDVFDVHDPGFSTTTYTRAEMGAISVYH